MVGMRIEGGPRSSISISNRHQAARVGGSGTAAAGAGGPQVLRRPSLQCVRRRNVRTAAEKKTQAAGGGACRRTALRTTS